MRPAHFVFTVLAAATLAGCSHGAPGDVHPVAPAYVRVENQSFSQMTVYAVRSSTRIRLGQVGGNSTEIFELPRSLVNIGVPIRFQADPLAGRASPFTQEIAVGPGDTVVLRIPPP